MPTGPEQPLSTYPAPGPAMLPICVGRNSAPAVTPGYRASLPFTGGTIDRMVVDLSGDGHVDREAAVRAGSEVTDPASTGTYFPGSGPGRPQ